MNKRKIEVKDRFVLEALRSTGYDVYSAIYELIDNSIDARSTKIDIIYDKDKKTLSIVDNGKGMSMEKLDESMNIGCDRAYSTSEIGYFGVGLKSSCLNLIDLDENPLIEIITSNGIENTKVEWYPTENPLEYNINKINENIDAGTNITIKGVKKFSPQILKKNIGTIYFPLSKSDNVKIYVNDNSIIFNDPLYRDSELTVKNYVTASVNGINIDIVCSLINDSQEKHSWDINTDEGKWSFSKGGIYMVYGGRYIEYGGTFGVKNNDPWDSRTRIEFEVPKELTEQFQIKFNKTNGISLKGNEIIEDVVRKIKDMFNWGKRIRLLNGETIATKDEKIELQKINDDLNKSAERANLKVFNQINKEKVEFTTSGKEKNKKDKPQTKANIYAKKTFGIRIENLGNTGCFWHLGFENNIFIITLNESHVFYREIYRNMNEGSKKDIIYFLASMAYAEYETKFNGNDINEEFFWEDYWSQVSTRLKHLISL